MHVLLTGGNGFIAAHVLNVLLDRGHTVVTTVRSEPKAAQIREAHRDLSEDVLSVAIVPDIAKHGAFDPVFTSTPRPFDAIIHTASPLTMNVTDMQKEVLDPAIVGTTGLLESTARLAPTVRRFILLSSFAAMIDLSKGDRPGHVYTSADWNPITLEESLKDAVNGYRGSKTFAERAAWEFMEKERPGFSLTTICPPFVFGPVVGYLASLDALNNSNRRFVAFLNGMLLPTTFYAWVDVRDLALGHVKAMEDETTAGERVFFTSGEQFCNEDILKIIEEDFPEYKGRLPDKREWASVGWPKEGVYGVDAKRTREILGEEFRGLRECVKDTVGLLKTFGV